MDLYTTLVVMHIVGAVIGTGGATFAEIFLIKAFRDKVMEPIESGYLRTIYTTIRWGLFLTLISGFGFLFLYRVEGYGDIYSEKLWAKLTIIIILAIAVLLMQAKKMPFWLGSSISLVSWYSATFLGFFRNISLGYVDILLWYVLAVLLGIIILEKIRKYFGVTI